MTSGMTNSTSIDNMLRTFISEAQFVQEHKEIMAKAIDTQRLPLKQGRNWNEPYLNALTAVDLLENSEYDDPQQISDTNVQITPSEKGCQVLWPVRFSDLITESLPSIAGKLIANAIEYKRDTDLLTLLDGFGASMGTSGTETLTVGAVMSALSAIREGIALSGGSNRTGARSTGDPSTSPLKVVIHNRMRYDIASQLSGLGGAPTQVTTGAAVMNFAGQMLGEYNQKWIETHYAFHIDGAMVLTDNNIDVSGSTAKGAAFEQDALVHITFRGMREKSVKSDDADRFIKQTVVVDYGFGERKDAGGVELFYNATAPAA